MQTSTLASVVALFSLMGPILALPQDNDQYLTLTFAPEPSPTPEPTPTITVAPVESSVEAPATTSDEEEYTPSTSDCPTTTITVQMWGDEPRVMTIGGAEFGWVYIKQKYETDSEEEDREYDLEEITSMPHATYKTYDGTAVPTDMETGSGGGGAGGYSISGPKGTANVGGSGDKYSGSGRVVVTPTVVDTAVWVLISGGVLMGAIAGFAL